MEKIAQGAEAVVYRADNCIVKHRIPKGYRHETIDTELRRTRTRHEAKILMTLQKNGFPAPRVTHVNDIDGRLEMERIPGVLVRQVFDEKYKELAKDIGKKVALLHSLDIIHGDLTTSNMIFNDMVYFIDFGLGFFSLKVEDKAVDLHLLDRALESSHFSVYPACMEMVLESYGYHYTDAERVLRRYNDVQRRGRHKEKY